MNENMHNKSLEDALIQHLRYSGLDKENLADLVRVAATLHSHGLGKPRVNPLGIPVPDGLRLSGDVDLASMGRLLSEILPKTSRWAGVVVFPKGIPWPEAYHVEIDLGPLKQPAKRFG